MAEVNDNNTVALYGESTTNFGAAYAATQESVKTQSMTIALMQTQLQAMHQYCMGLQQQPPPTIYAPQQQAQGGRGPSPRNQSSGGRGGGRQQTPAYHPLMTAGQHMDSPPTSYKCYKNWNYYSTHGEDIAVTHNSHPCTGRDRITIVRRQG